MVLAVAGLGSVAYFAVLGLFGERSVSAQTDTFLARRVDQIEQRFYMLESRMNRVELDTRRPTGITSTIPNAQAVEIQYLRTQVESLRTRIGEVECGLLRVDERTLSTTARGMRGTVVNPDPCRREPNFPVQLSSRPGS